MPPPPAGVIQKETGRQQRWGRESGRGDDRQGMDKEGDVGPTWLYGI
jgi:hypothetical protein